MADKGSVRMAGPVDRVVKAYEEDFRRREDQLTRSENRRHAETLALIPAPDDFEDDGCWRLRIVPESGRQLHDIHYIHNVKLSSPAGEISLGLGTGDELNASISFDFMDSEWGRPYERAGKACRVLASTTSKRRGGHILVSKRIINSPDLESGLELSIEVVHSDTAGNEPLALEYLDEASGAWTRLQTENANSTGGVSRVEWRLSRFRGRIPCTASEVVAATRQRVRLARMPDVVIAACLVISEGEVVHSLLERQPFQIKIQADVIRPVERLDFGVRIYRADGVYAFWQSSGEQGGNVAAPSGRADAVFEFDPNLFPAGRYQVTAYAANGWDPDRNYPYSEVYDRKINLTEFTVMREYVKVDYGALNQRVRTHVALEPAVPVAEAIPASAIGEG